MRVRWAASGRTRLAGAQPQGGKTKATKVEGIESVEAKEVSFVEHLRETSDLRFKEILDELLEDIDEAGQRFLEYPNYGNLLTYKSLVQKFMKMVIERLYRVKERLSSKATTQQKIYTIIEEVDQRLKLLTDEVLSGQSDPLNLMAQIDEIRGMLVDLYS